MFSKSHAGVFGLVLGLALALGGCHHHPVHRGHGHGPPPHAPAHGYRHKHHHGHDLVFDAGLGAYVVVGLPDVYFSDGHFFRRHGGGWEMAPEPGGPWREARARALPPGLAKKHGKGGGHGHGRHGGKHGHGGRH